MSETRPEPHGLMNRRSEDVPADELCGELVEYDDEPAEFTLYPAGASEDELVTTWMTAREDAFVDIVEMR